MRLLRSSLLRLLALFLFVLMPGPAVLLQQVAWINMLVSYTQERGLKRGVIETFDGNHPCKLCRKAAELRQQEQPQDPSDKQAPSQRPRLAWAEMVAVERLKAPSITGHDFCMSAPSLIARDSGIGAGAPDSPPPERV